jgi:NTP pyrophosphatase (non-canonical NTP hydrolase)
MQPSRDIRRLIDIMAALRDPVHGCPWDVEQTFASIAPFTIEEAYEVADAIERRGTEDLREELGDLLLQSSFMPAWRKRQACLILAASSRPSPPNSCGDILMSSETPRPSVLTK